MKPVLAGFGASDSLVSGDFGFMLQGESNFIQPLQQAMAGKFVDLEGSGKSMPVVHLALFEIDGDFVIGDFPRFARDLAHIRFAERNCKHAIFQAIVSENVGERRSNYHPEPEAGKRPDGMLAGRSTAEVLPRDQDARASVS